MLKGKVVAVTGAGRGIGRAIARLCAAEGASVVVNDPGVSTAGEGGDATPAQDVVSEIRAAGGRAIANLANITDPAGASSIIDDAISTFGRIDAVVNNAGFLRDAPFYTMSQTDWDDIIDVHLNGYFYVARAAARHFKEQGCGAYVHFTSPSGLIGSLDHANYAAAKLGVVGLSTSIALEMQQFGVRSNCIAPFAWSRLVALSLTDQPEHKQITERMKQVTPEQIAPLVAFLCADAAADVTGQVFGIRKNEVFLFSRPQIVRSAHKSDGWTPASVRDELLPMLQPSLQPLQRARDVFTWDPV